MASAPIEKNLPYRVPAWAFGAAAAPIALGLDQATKWLVADVIVSAAGPIHVFSFLNLVASHNRGIAFGLFRGDGDLHAMALSLLALAIVGGLLLALLRSKKLRTAIPLGLIIGGAGGNVLDRIDRGAVRDFIDFHVGEWHWPAFNLADTAIVIGIAVLAWATWQNDRKEGPAKRTEHST
jgi:signal peptidase II